MACFHQHSGGVLLPALSMMSVGHVSFAWAPTAFAVSEKVGGGPSAAATVNVYLPLRSPGTATLRAANEDAYALRLSRNCCSLAAAVVITDCASARDDLRSWLVYAGNAIAASIATTSTAISNSISVKPRLRMSSTTCLMLPGMRRTFVSSIAVSSDGNALGIK